MLDLDKLFKEIYILSINTFANINFRFELHNSFDIYKFRDSINIVSKKINIPMYVINKQNLHFRIGKEINFYIQDNILIVNCSHKFYDATSLFIILNLIDDKYKNFLNEETIYYDSVFHDSDYSFSSLFNQIPYVSQDDFILFKETKESKSITIINEISDFFKNFYLCIIINTRKQLNINPKQIGSYSNFYYTKEIAQKPLNFGARLNPDKYY
jgi:hypothetical protein